MFTEKETNALLDFLDRVDVYDRKFAAQAPCFSYRVIGVSVSLN